jgi:hypothetical protein
LLGGSAYEVGASGAFDYFVDVPGDVKDIKFGEKRVVIWKR